jgi:hypothetical protein
MKKAMANASQALPGTGRRHLCAFASCPAGASSATTSLATARPRSSASGGSGCRGRPDYGCCWRVESLWPDIQAARQRTSQMVAAMSSTDSASSQPPSIHWNGQNRLAGW